MKKEKIEYDGGGMYHWFRLIDDWILKNTKSNSRKRKELINLVSGMELYYRVWLEAVRVSENEE